MESQPRLGLWPERRPGFGSRDFGPPDVNGAGLVRALFWIGVVVLILGVVSLVVPIPHRERDGIAIGGVSIGVETRHEDRIHPALSAVLIAGGLGSIVAGKGKSS